MPPPCLYQLLVLLSEYLHRLALRGKYTPPHCYKKPCGSLLLPAGWKTCLQSICFPPRPSKCSRVLYLQPSYFHHEICCQPPKDSAVKATFPTSWKRLRRAQRGCGWLFLGGVGKDNIRKWSTSWWEYFDSATNSTSTERIKLMSDGVETESLIIGGISVQLGNPLLILPFTVGRKQN